MCKGHVSWAWVVTKQATRLFPNEGWHAHSDFWVHQSLQKLAGVYDGAGAFLRSGHDAMGQPH